MAKSGDWDLLQSWCLLSQQSSNSKKDKEALEDKRRNPILKYIGKPKGSSQSSEYMGGGGLGQGRQPHPRPGRWQRAFPVPAAARPPAL